MSLNQDSNSNATVPSTPTNNPLPLNLFHPIESKQAPIQENGVLYMIFDVLKKQVVKEPVQTTSELELEITGKMKCLRYLDPNQIDTKTGKLNFKLEASEKAHTNYIIIAVSTQPNSWPQTEYSLTKSPREFTLKDFINNEKMPQYSLRFQIAKSESDFDLLPLTTKNSGPAYLAFTGSVNKINIETQNEPKYLAELNKTDEIYTMELDVNGSLDAVDLKVNSSDFSVGQKKSIETLLESISVSASLMVFSIFAVLFTGMNKMVLLTVPMFLLHMWFVFWHMKTRCL